VLQQKTEIGICSPTTKRAPALFSRYGGFFMSSTQQVSLAVGQGAFGLAVLSGGLQTCLTAIFRFAAKGGEDLFH